MRFKILAAALAGVLTLSACETTGGGYGGGGYGNGGGGTQLSRCTRNALIGAGVGAVVGAVTAPEGNRGENAAIGAAAGGLGTYGVCRWLQARDQANIERGYQQALAENRATNSSWQSDSGANRSVYVNTPQASDRGPNCRRITATVQDPQYGRQDLPPETYCRTANGQWAPV
ncbi:MAG: YMGG-like glycine zipper-containing protein [Hyphomonadaceae bacterium]